VPEASTFALFVVAALALLLVPGPAVFYVVARSVEGGRATGLVSVLGVELGTLVHVVFAAIGLSAVLVSSATAFTVVKWLGAAYLLYLGLQHLLARNGDDEEELPAGGATRLPRVFTQSVLVQVLNPKVALFFLAFLPQFVDPSRGAAWTQVVVLGATLAVLGLLTDGIYALVGGAASDWLKRRRSAGAGPSRVRRYVSGGIYLALGAATAVSGSGKD
jgi:threonine/homoserine/homoserine lactone efflux protein